MAEGMCMGRRKLKHGKADEIYKDILYLITKKSCVVIAALKHLVTTELLVFLPWSQKACVSHGLVAFTILILNI